MKEITQMNRDIDPHENEKKEHVFRCIVEVNLPR